MYHFDVYQYTNVSAIDATIYTLIPVVIATTPYRKVLISNTLFRQIFINTETSFVYISNVPSTIAVYFDMDIAMV